MPYILTFAIIQIAFLTALPGISLCEKIRIGGIMDCTGTTSDVGRDYARGMADAFEYINSQGGVNGKLLTYTWFDFGCRIPEAITKFKMLNRLGSVAIMGWGTASTEALLDQIIASKMPYISASYAAEFTTPEKAPYNVFFASDYSTSAKACILTWFLTRWPKHYDNGKRKPRLACCYMFDSPYCTAPIAALKEQANLLGFEIGNDQDISLSAKTAVNQISALKNFQPDLVWHGNTTTSVAATIKEGS